MITSVGMLFVNNVFAKHYVSKFAIEPAGDVFIVSAKAMGSNNSGAANQDSGKARYSFEIDVDKLDIMRDITQTGGKATIQLKTTRSLKVIYKGRSCYNAKLKVFISHLDGSHRDSQTLDEQGCAPKIANGIKDQSYAIDIKPWVENIKEGDSFVVEVDATVSADPGGKSRDDRAEVSWQIKMGNEPKLKLMTE